MSVEYPGCLYIVAAPSGGGKTSLVKKLVHSLENIEISVSHTTRSIRPQEKNEIDYFFVDENEFLAMQNRQEFIEYARVFDNFYGTSKSQITSRLEKGIDVLLDIDWQGAEQIKHQFKEAKSIFIIPPSLDILKKRLLDRAGDKPEVIRDRMIKARDELSHYPDFDYLIVNDDFEKAASELKAIVLANRLTMARQVKKQSKLLSFLMASQ